MIHALLNVQTVLTAACMLIGLSAFNTAAFADEPEQVIKYRKNVMKSIGGHMGASASIVQGKVSFKGDLKDHAHALALMSKDIVALFPKGSDFGETGAKDAVWEKPAEFKKAADAAKEKTAAFAKVVASGDTKNYVPAFKAVAETCKACHKTFRQKK